MAFNDEELTKNFHPPLFSPKQDENKDLGGLFVYVTATRSPFTMNSIERPIERSLDNKENVKLSSAFKSGKNSVVAVVNCGSTGVISQRTGVSLNDNVSSWQSRLPYASNNNNNSMFETSSPNIRFSSSQVSNSYDSLGDNSFLTDQESYLALWTLDGHFGAIPPPKVQGVPSTNSPTPQTGRFSINTGANSKHEDSFSYYVTKKYNQEPRSSESYSSFGYGSSRICTTGSYSNKNLTLPENEKLSACQTPLTQSSTNLYQEDDLQFYLEL
uniref:Uncharacterized protein n=1 Tax=Rhabditophanes sp. KR3021 TaxID=114890 RepID=A0AC35U7L0_9BILA